MATPHAAPAHPQPGNGMAVAGMVLGIVGLVLCWIPFLGWACALVGVILGALGMSRAKKIGGKGKGMAIAGLVCGIVGLLAGVLLFALTMMAARSFDSYLAKAKSSEARLELRSMETKIKAYYDMKSTLPPSGSLMPGPVDLACSNGSRRIPRQPQSAWDAAGWQEMGFHVDEDSRYAYQWTKKSNTEGVAVASTDQDCDGSPSTTTLTIQVIDGNVTASYSEPTED